MIDILDELQSLKTYAKKERSHYYVLATTERAIKEIERLRKAVDAAESVLRTCSRISA